MVVEATMQHEAEVTEEDVVAAVVECVAEGVAAAMLLVEVTEERAVAAAVEDVATVGQLAEDGVQAATATRFPILKCLME